VPTKNPIGQSVTKELAIAAHTVARAIATERRTATGGRAVKERAAAGGPIMRLKMSKRPDDRHGHGGGQREDDQERHLHPLAPDPLGLRDIGNDR
jgi:hypothetical protein